MSLHPVWVVCCVARVNCSRARGAASQKPSSSFAVPFLNVRSVCLLGQFTHP